MVFGVARRVHRLLRPAAFGQNRLPVLDELGRATVYFQPRQCFAEDGAMGERSLRFRARGQIAQPPLQADDQPQALDVAPRERQLAEARARRAPRRPVRSAADLVATCTRPAFDLIAT